MPYRKHLRFLFNVIRDKNDYQGSVPKCPFCDREGLTGIIAEDGPILLLENKFATLENTYQTVIIETDDCLADMSSYPLEYLQRLLTFSVDHWLRMEASGKYKSVVLYKNHGPLSGGTIEHAHMQIVGMNDIDYKDNLYDEMFEGIEITRDEDTVVNISTKPQACATEYNIIMPVRKDAFMARAIQIIVRSILKQCSSFNIFFYQWKGNLICKLAPRYVVSPFLIGYDIPQTTSRIPFIVDDLKKAFES